MLATTFLGEKVGIYRWTAVVAGLAGVVIITDPFEGTMTWYAIYGFGALVIIASCLVNAWRELARTRELNQPEI